MSANSIPVVSFERALQCEEGIEVGVDEIKTVLFDPTDRIAAVVGNLAELPPGNTVQPPAGNTTVAIVTSNSITLAHISSRWGTPGVDHANEMMVELSTRHQNLMAKQKLPMAYGVILYQRVSDVNKVPVLPPTGPYCPPSPPSQHRELTPEMDKIICAIKLQLKNRCNLGPTNIQYGDYRLLPGDAAATGRRGRTRLVMVAAEYHVRAWYENGHTLAGLADGLFADHRTHRGPKILDI